MFATTPRCPFCGSDNNREQLHLLPPGHHNHRCTDCQRTFLVRIKKRWWGKQMSTHVR